MENDGIHVGYNSGQKSGCSNDNKVVRDEVSIDKLRLRTTWVVEGQAWKKKKKTRLMIHTNNLCHCRIVDAKLGRLLCLLMGVGFYIAGFIKVINQ